MKKNYRSSLYFVSGVHCGFLQCPICDNIFCVSPQTVLDTSSSSQRSVACTWCNYTDNITQFKKGRLDK